MEVELETDRGEALMEILDKRWSPRAFSDEPISEENILKIFDAGKQVASSYNEQPWAVILAKKNTQAYKKLYESLIDFNQSWVETAPYLGVVLAKQHFGDQDRENRHCFYDSGAFMAVSTLRATTLDIFVHQMAGFSPETVAENFDIPEDYKAITMFVFGKIGDTEQLPEKLQERESPESDRKKSDEFLFLDEWGKAFNQS